MCVVFTCSLVFALVSLAFSFCSYIVYTFFPFTIRITCKKIYISYHVELKCGRCQPRSRKAEIFAISVIEVKTTWSSHYSIEQSSVMF